MPSARRHSTPASTVGRPKSQNCAGPFCTFEFAAHPVRHAWLIFGASAAHVYMYHTCHGRQTSAPCPRLLQAFCKRLTEVVRRTRTHTHAHTLHRSGRCEKSYEPARQRSGSCGDVRTARALLLDRGLRKLLAQSCCTCLRTCKLPCRTSDTARQDGTEAGQTPSS